MAAVTLTTRYTDETFYEDIFRVEPGCAVYLTRKGELRKTRYWALDPEVHDLKISSDKSCLSRFSDLLEESLLYYTNGVEDGLAGELSGGLDSSTILTAAKALGLNYPLFMHVAPEPENNTTGQ
ncbi:MAG: hypothetical protein COV52_05960 [Gammaproteobacteria bacterium CG11_big_fil_rev_8_21_14_0_20_46_22]|nr:MAG: hypothetical protein COW05_07700 [Gammaproteobacteria bacterium CG12_big_fil_rev_8_21_14_0_65_46_12]PIR11048.1 MAG: hypothetical protein COV52_05960 [Gammaproteobacteria bacterium CG11_big_fil_rev_8_21_14_0_20_46_22]